MKKVIDFLRNTVGYGTCAVFIIWMIQSFDEIWWNPWSIGFAIVASLVCLGGTIGCIGWLWRTLDRAYDAVAKRIYENKKIRWIDGTSVHRKEVLWI